MSCCRHFFGLLPQYFEHFESFIFIHSILIRCMFSLINLIFTLFLFLLVFNRLTTFVYLFLISFAFLFVFYPWCLINKSFLILKYILEVLKILLTNYFSFFWFHIIFTSLYFHRFCLIIMFFLYFLIFIEFIYTFRFNIIYMFIILFICVNIFWRSSKFSILS